MQTPVPLEPRTSTLAAKAVRASSSSGTLSLMSIGRASTDPVGVAAWYQAVFGATVSHSVDTATVTRRCIQYTSSAKEVCFTKRGASSTKGSFSVADFEAAMNATHDKLLTGQPLCGLDKWLDNHHAFDSQSFAADRVVSWIDATSDAKVYCDSASSLHYLIDPTGWGIQLDLSFSNAPAKCKGSARFGGDYNPACDLGTCSAQAVVV